MAVVMIGVDPHKASHTYRPIVGRRCGPLAGMAVSLARSVERSRQAWLSYPLSARCWAWLSNDVPACRGLAVAWL